MDDVANIATALGRITEHWSPRVVAQVNDHYVKVAKIQGEFVWHQHEGEDELFYILRGSLRMEYEDRAVTLTEGDMRVVPRATRHRPIAVEECWIMLVEPVETLHTGDVTTPLTRSIAEQLG